MTPSMFRRLDPIVEAARDGEMTQASSSLLIGKWRIVESDLWDTDHLDLVEPAYMSIQEDGWGEIAFGALNASLDCEYAPGTIFFTWIGFEEMDEVGGTGSAELNEDGTVSIEFAYHSGDEAELTARPW